MLNAASLRFASCQVLIASAHQSEQRAEIRLGSNLVSLAVRCRGWLLWRRVRGCRRGLLHKGGGQQLSLPGGRWPVLWKRLRRSGQQVWQIVTRGDESLVSCQRRRRACFPN